MVVNGVSTSNSLDLAMSGLALLGFGTAIAGGYFLLNSVTILTTGKDIGQHIDSAAIDINGKTLIENIKAVGN